MKKITKLLGALVLIGFLATTSPVMAQSDTTATTTQTADHDDDDDNGNWGLAGLLGLLGLLGLRRNDRDDRRTDDRRTTNTVR